MLLKKCMESTSKLAHFQRPVLTYLYAKNCAKKTASFVHLERIGTLSPILLKEVEDGLRLVLSL
jgi:hypothetical protein